MSFSGKVISNPLWSPSTGTGTYFDMGTYFEMSLFLALKEYFAWFHFVLLALYSPPPDFVGRISYTFYQLSKQNKANKKYIRPQKAEGCWGPQLSPILAIWRHSILATQLCYKGQNSTYFICLKESHKWKPWTFVLNKLKNKLLSTTSCLGSIDILPYLTDASFFLLCITVIDTGSRRKVKTLLLAFIS